MKYKQILQKIILMVFVGFSLPLWAAVIEKKASLPSSPVPTLPSNPLSSPPVVNNLYTVENVMVDIKSSSAQMARNEALLDAQRKAFIELVRRLVPENERHKFINLSNEEIEFVVQDFEVIREKISKIRYIGMLTIRFNPTAVEKVLMGNGSKIQPQVKVLTETLIIPLFKQNQHILLWEEKNPWFIAWGQKTPTIEGQKFSVPVGDLADIKELSAEDALSGHHAKIAKLMQRYGVERSLIVFLNMDGGTPSLELYQYAIDGPVGVIPMTPIEGVGQGGGDIHAIIQLALNKVAGLVPQLEQEFQAALTPQRMEMIAEFTTLSEWLEMRRVLEKTPNVRGLTILSLGRSQAHLSFQQVGSRQNIETFLQVQGFSVEIGKGDTLKIRLGKKVTPITPMLSVTAPVHTQSSIQNTPPASIDESTSSAQPTGVTPHRSPYYMPSEVVPLTNPDLSSGAQPIPSQQESIR